LYGNLLLTKSEEKREVIQQGNIHYKLNASIYLTCCMTYQSELRIELPEKGQQPINQTQY